MKPIFKISLIACFFAVLAGLTWAGSLKTSTPSLETSAEADSSTKLSASEEITEKATRPPEKKAESSASQFDSKKLLNVNNIVSGKLGEIEFNGTFLIAVGDEVIYHKAIGYSDAENKTPLSLDTKYEIGSCSKQFTAAAIAKLAQENKLSIKDKVTKYVKEAKLAKNITVEQLLNMCSGLPDYLNQYIYMLEAGERDTDTDFSKKEFLEWLNKQGLNFQPGEFFAYSNTNYYLLGMIIEEVSGKSYEEYIKDEIFYPAYMDNSSLCMSDTTCKGYLDSNWTQGIKVDSSYFYSAGEIVSTTTDMLKWMNAFSRGEILNHEMLKKATHTGSDGFNYGFGWFVTDDYYYHTGNTELYYAIDIFNRKHDMKIIGLSNVNNTELQRAGLNIMSAVENELFPSSNKKRNGD